MVAICTGIRPDFGTVMDSTASRGWLRGRRRVVEFDDYQWLIKPNQL